MCDPISIASLAISATSGVVGFMGQQAQYKQQQATYEQNRLNAMAALRNQQQASGLRQIQEQTAAANEKFDTSLEARSARATALAAAGQTNVTGVSVEHLLRDYYVRESRFNDRVDTNLDWSMQQIQAEKEAQGYKAVDRINSVPRGTKPSFADAALRIAGTGVSALTSYEKKTGKSLWS